MVLKVAINGFGRIGRNALRALYECGRLGELKVVAINDLGDVDSYAHLLKFDSSHGIFGAEVGVEGGALVVNGDVIPFSSEPDLVKLPWGQFDVDVVFECTGRFTNRQDAEKHLVAGAKKVLISAPAGEDVDATVVFGVNDDVLRPEHTVVSNASCTTNCLATVAKVLNDAVGIEDGLMCTVHSYTNDQHLTDSFHVDLHRARAAAVSMIPTKTGVAKAIGLVLPELDGKLQGYSLRVPTMNVSVVDFTFSVKRSTSIEEVHEVVKSAAEGAFKGVLAFNELPLVSIDFNHNSHSAIFDATQTLVAGKLVKVLAWYDNEWGFCNRMLDTALVMGR